MIVLDTNVLSELMRPQPAAEVLGWVRAQPGAELVTTAVSVAEILYGIQRLPAGRRHTQLLEAAREVFAQLSEQVLPFDAAAAAEYAELVTARHRDGEPISGFDAQIAAICRARRASLATRNIADFAHTGVRVINPFAG